MKYFDNNIYLNDTEDIVGSIIDSQVNFEKVKLHVTSNFANLLVDLTLFCKEFNINYSVEEQYYSKTLGFQTVIICFNNLTISIKLILRKYFKNKVDQVFIEYI